MFDSLWANLAVALVAFVAVIALGAFVYRMLKADSEYYVQESVPSPPMPTITIERAGLEAQAREVNFLRDEGPSELELHEQRLEALRAVNDLWVRVAKAAKERAATVLEDMLPMGNALGLLVVKRQLEVEEAHSLGGGYVRGIEKSEHLVCAYRGHDVARHALIIPRFAHVWRDGAERLGDLDGYKKALEASFEGYVNTLSNRIIVGVMKHESLSNRPGYLRLRPVELLEDGLLLSEEFAEVYAGSSRASFSEVRDPVFDMKITQVQLLGPDHDTVEWFVPLPVNAVQEFLAE